MASSIELGMHALPIVRAVCRPMTTGFVVDQDSGLVVLRIKLFFEIDVHVLVVL